MMRFVLFTWFSILVPIFPICENVRERKYKRKIEENKKWKKIKSRLKTNKLFLFVISNLFYLF